MVYELVRGLTAAGHHVTLFATGDSQSRHLRFVYPTPVWPPDPRVELFHCRSAARAIARERFDVVHAHAPSMIFFADELATPCVYTIHHAHDDRLADVYRRRPGVHYVAISNRQAQLEPELACQVIHHGLDPERYPLGRGGGYAAFLGRIARCKGPELAIGAARAAGLPIRLAGEIHAADATPDWQIAMASAFSQRGVHHVGQVGGTRKAEFLGGARALLMPLRWEEPFGLVMIEAMLCGTPVIAFRRGAAPEIVDEGVTGFLVADVDEMAFALAKLDRFDRFDRAGCRCRARARFSAGRMVLAYERLYARAIARLDLAGGAEESSYAG